ncbi:MAG: L-2-hydroxyglutarate oxidase, partial [Acidimicrobiia bacterium]|nr:L-2-hydroxyglutarate oxidase [Acidimicrobiia bacterium]
VRAQAVSEKGDLLDDFLFEEGTQSLHVLNAPSPAATASLAIGEYIASKVLS